MRNYVMKLAFAAGVVLVGAVHAEEQSPVATGSISPARPPAELAAPNLNRAGFGFSPFLEEELVGELPPLRRGELRVPAPAYLREFRRPADP